MYIHHHATWMLYELCYIKRERYVAHCNLNHLVLDYSSSSSTSSSIIGTPSLISSLSSSTLSPQPSSSSISLFIVYNKKAALNISTPDRHLKLAFSTEHMPYKCHPQSWRSSSPAPSWQYADLVFSGLGLDAHLYLLYTHFHSGVQHIIIVVIGH